MGENDSASCIPAAVALAEDFLRHKPKQNYRNGNRNKICRRLCPVDSFYPHESGQYNSKRNQKYDFPQHCNK